MPRRSAGLMLFRRGPDGLEVLLVHPGGPYWSKRDDGSWSIPKGEYGPDEDAHATALREFIEELGAPPPDGVDLYLGEVRQPGGKIVTAWARAGDFDAGDVVSNTFEMEWPPRSGQRQSFPEVDRAAWFTLKVAKRKINAGQAPLLETLRSMA